MNNIYETLSTYCSVNRSFALCTVVAVRGSTPRQTGAKMLVFEDGSIKGTIGGGAVEKKVIGNAVLLMKEGKSQLFRHDLLHQHGMCCGGTMDIFIDPVMTKNRLYIFGAGHTGQALAKYAADFDFEIVMIDDRKEYLDACKDERISRMNLLYRQALPLLPFDEKTYVCIMTYSHSDDREILAFCLNKPHAYLGMIGSVRKVELTKKMFGESGLGTQEQLSSVDMPMGLQIGAEGPEEIALSILGKLIGVKNKVTV